MNQQPGDPELAMTADRWRAVSGELDRALELPDSELQAWLASLRKRDPASAAWMMSLLAARNSDAFAGFLQESASVLVRDSQRVTDPAGADQILARAAALAVDADGEPMPSRRAINVLRARCAQARGDGPTTHTAARAALHHLEDNLGEDHPYTLLARTLATTSSKVGPSESKAVSRVGF